jgi:hypothetical protein
MRKKSQLSVRITDEEMSNLRALADQNSVLLSQLVRNILAANAKETAVGGLLQRPTVGIASTAGDQVTA